MSPPVSPKETSWRSDGVRVTVRTWRRTGESEADWARRHQYGVDTMKDAWPED